MFGKKKILILNNKSDRIVVKDSFSLSSSFKSLPICLKIILNIMAILFLFIIGLVISRSTGKNENEHITIDSTNLETIRINLDENLKSTQIVNVNIPRAHISNQHRGLGKLSEAIDLIEKSDLKKDLNEEDNFNIHHHFFNKHSNYGSANKSGFLKRIMLRNKSVTCNDGTKAGYYFRPSIHYSKKWIVFLEGGWYCFSVYSCHQRWLKMRNLMTSAHWPEIKTVGGILSQNKEENPFLWNANHVYVPYCSSDCWSGDFFAKTSADLSFLGWRIIEEVFYDLLNQRLSDADTLLFAGSSAGAAGVLVNLDRIANLLASKGLKTKVKGIIDSGWFLDNEPFQWPIKSNSNQNQKQSSSSLSSYVPFSSSLLSQSSSSSLSSFANPCTNAMNCAPIEAVKLGIKLWNGQVPQKCREKYRSEAWRCYFGYRMYPSLKTPVFVIQWIFDEAQMIVDNVGEPITREQWSYVHKMGRDMKLSLQNVSAVFAPSCVSHIVLTKNNWNKIEINGISLAQALSSWDSQKCKEDRFKVDLNLNPILFSKNNIAHGNRRNRSVSSSSKSYMFFDSPRFSPLSNRYSPLIKSTGFRQLSLSSLTSSFEKIKKKSNKKRRKKKKRRHQQFTNEALSFIKNEKTRKEENRLDFSNNRILREKKCNYRIIDSCSWPHCNSNCPKLHNLFTALKLDLRTSNSMEDKQPINFLN